MTLALVIEGHLDRRSGGYSYDTDLVAHCQSLGHTVEVWSLPRTTSHARKALAARLDTAPVVIFDALVHPAIVDLLEERRPHSKACWVGLVHHLAWLEDPQPGGSTRKKQDKERRFLESMDAYLFNSEDTRRSVVALRGPGAGFRPGVVLPPPLTYQPVVPAPDQGRLLFLGNLVPRKNLEGLVEALSLVAGRRPDLEWSLTVAGSPDLDPGYASRCQSLAESRGLGSRLTWAGRVSEEEKAGLWASTDLLTLPSFHEGWGMAHAEALSRGIPALAVPQGGAAEVLGDAALWSPPDAENLSRALERFLDHRGFRDDLRLKVRHRRWVAGSTGFAGLGDFLEGLVPAPAKGNGSEVAFEDYLEAKASVDARSLHPRVMEAAFADPPHTVLELGGGTGTMARRLAGWGRVGPDTAYVLVDQNGAGLALARQRTAGLFAPGRFQTREANLLSLWEEAHPQAPDLVIAHALLDLFDPRTAAPALARLGARRYWLTHLFDGMTAWEPRLDPDLDEALMAAYHRSMDERAPGGAQGSSRSGRDWLVSLPAAGFRILEVGASDWVVRPENGGYPDQEAVFLKGLLGFFRHSLTGRHDVDQRGLAWWLAGRSRQVDRGEVSFLAHQLDIAAELAPGTSLTS